MVAAPDGLHLIEIKNWHGHLTNEGRHWSRGGRFEKGPLDLTVQKSKELADYLKHEARRSMPLRGAVRATRSTLHGGTRDAVQPRQLPAPARLCARPGAERPPAARRDLLFEPRAGRHRTPRFLEALPQLLAQDRYQRRGAQSEVGAWTLDPRPYDEGPTWQDFHATRSDIAGNPHRRVRVYLEARLGDEDARRSVRGAAEREFKVAAGVHHPGILAPADLEEHELGPALIIEQEPVRGASRPLAGSAPGRGDDATGGRASCSSSPRRRVRPSQAPRTPRPAPRAVIVESGGRCGSASGRSPLAVCPQAERNQRGSDLALRRAPRLRRRGLPRTRVRHRRSRRHVDVDIFGVGAIVLPNPHRHPPAAARAELNERLVRDGGLNPGTGNEALDQLVFDATRPKLEERTPSVDDILDSLRELAQARRPEKDPLEDRRWAMSFPAGTESCRSWARAARRAPSSCGVMGSSRYSKSVEALSRRGCSSAEAAALEDLRHHHVVLLRRASFPLGSRHAIELANAGASTLADVLATHGPLPSDELRAVGDQVLSAAEYLEGRGVAHRDVKPSNIGVRGEGVDRMVTLFDFSLALTQQR